MKKCKSMLALLLAMLMTVSMVSVPGFAADETVIQPEWDDPGAINLSKVANTLLDANGNPTGEYEVTLTIQGKNFTSGSDTVLVIDCSGGMYNPGVFGIGKVDRVTPTKAAAKAFGETLLTAGSGNRIAVVTFGNYATQVTTGLADGVKFYSENERDAFLELFDDDGTQEAFLKESINSAAEGTNQQAGLNAARELLKNSSAVNQNILILSDGKPTYGYAFLVADEANPSNPPVVRGYETSDRIGGGNGLGNSLLTWGNAYNSNDSLVGNYSYNYTTKTFDYVAGADWGSANLDACTIREAQLAKAEGITIYSVALQTGSEGETLLATCATNPVSGAFVVGENDDVGATLGSAFTSIAQNIAIAASNGVVSDPMGEKVDLVYTGTPTVTNTLTDYEAGNANIYISQGDVTWDPTAENNNGKITWNVGSINEGTDAVMKYKVKPNGATTGEVIPTNGETSFTYINYQGKTAVAYFDVPSIAIGAGTIRMHYYAVNAAGEPINAAGEVVDAPAYAEQLQEPVYYTVKDANDKDTASLSIPNTYNITAAAAIKDNAYYGYVIGDGYTTSDAKTETPAVVDLSYANANQEVWFAYEPGFIVKHVQDGAVVKTDVYPVSESVNLTACVPAGTDKENPGYLYGGTFTDAACTEAITGDPMNFTPTKQTDGTYGTYYISELDAAYYLYPVVFSAYGNAANAVVGVFPATLVDRDMYDAVDFELTGGATMSTRESEVVYEKMVITAGKVDNTFAPSDSVFIKDGYLACAQLDSFDTTLDADETYDSFVLRPYWITADGVKVYSTLEKTCTYQGLGAQTLKVETTFEGALCELAYPTSGTADFAPLTLRAVFYASDEEVVEPETPVEPETKLVTVTVVDGETYTAEFEPGNLSGQINYQGAEGKIFAGWYTDEAYTTPADFTSVEEDMTVYAKYVDDTYLDATLIPLVTFRNRSLSMVAAVGDAEFTESGFLVSVGDATEKVVAAKYATRYNGLPAKMLIDWSLGRSTLMMTSTYDLSGVQRGTEITVTPYWVTPDGTTVYGTVDQMTYNIRSFKW